MNVSSSCLHLNYLCLIWVPPKVCHPRSTGSMRAPSHGVSALCSDLHLVQVFHYISTCHCSSLIYAWQFITNACPKNNHHRQEAYTGTETWWQNLVRSGQLDDQEHVYVTFFYVIIKIKKKFNSYNLLMNNPFSAFFFLFALLWFLI